MIMVLSIFTSSCQETWCGETDLGNRFALVSDKPIQILFCTSDDICCNSGWIGVPGGVIEYGYDEKWIIAKRDTDDYWIINKDFEIDLSGFDVPGRYEFYESHITGNLTKLEYERMKDSLNINIELAKVK